MMCFLLCFLSRQAEDQQHHGIRVVGFLLCCLRVEMSYEMPECGGSCQDHACYVATQGWAGYLNSSKPVHIFEPRMTPPFQTLQTRYRKQKPLKIQNRILTQMLMPQFFTCSPQTADDCGNTLQLFALQPRLCSRVVL